ncbi:MAG: CPBP family intramembrane metalloprotease [Saprospiraceae bacterium]|nr:CPBP family intramembrane metalloprotease [Saprospiraceae bacterium]
MNHSIAPTNRYTWIGLLLSMFGITAINETFKYTFGSQLTNGQMMAKESLIFGLVGFLLFYIIPKEKLTLESIGLHNRHWGRSLIWVVIIFIVSIAAILGCLEICKLLGWQFGESKSFDLLSKPVIAFVTLRAGVAEEVFMRGFLLERLTVITGKKWMAFMLSTIPFGLLHYPQGYAGILIATVAGGVLALFYFWKKDLKANIIAHFLVDFIPNVLLT